MTSPSKVEPPLNPVEILLEAAMSGGFYPKSVFTEVDLTR